MPDTQAIVEAKHWITSPALIPVWAGLAAVLGALANRLSTHPRFNEQARRDQEKRSEGRTIQQEILAGINQNRESYDRLQDDIKALRQFQTDIVFPRLPKIDRALEAPRELTVRMDELKDISIKALERDGKILQVLLILDERSRR